MDVEQIFNKITIYDNKRDEEKKYLKNNISNFISSNEIKIRSSSDIHKAKTGKVIQTLIDTGIFTNINYNIFTFPNIRFNIGRDANVNESDRMLYTISTRISHLIPVTDENLHEAQKFLTDNGYTNETVNLQNVDDVNAVLHRMLTQINNRAIDRREFVNTTPISYISKLFVDNDIEFEIIDEDSLRTEHHQLMQLLENNDTYANLAIFNGNARAENAKRIFNKRMKRIMVVKITNKVLELKKLHNGISPKNSVLAFHGSGRENYLSLILNGFLTRDEVGIEAAGQLYGINAVYFGTDLSALIWQDSYSMNSDYFNLEMDENKAFIYGDISKFTNIRRYGNRNDIRRRKNTVAYSAPVSNRIISYNSRDTIYIDDSDPNYDYLFIVPETPRTIPIEDKYLFISGQSSIYINNRNRNDTYYGVIFVKINKNYRLSGGKRGNSAETLNKQYVFELVAEVDVGTPLVTNKPDQRRVLTKENVNNIGCDSILAPRYEIYPDESSICYRDGNDNIVQGGTIDEFQDRAFFRAIKTSFPLRYKRNRNGKLNIFDRHSSQSISIFNSNQATPKYLLIYKRE